MAAFELDMAFAIADIADGATGLFAKRGYRWVRRNAGTHVLFLITLGGGHTALMRIEPLPAARETHTLFSPRSLVLVSSADADPAQLSTLRREIILAFLRVTG